MNKAETKGTASPFVALERWIEFMGSHPISVWVRFKGVPLYAWHEVVFKLLGDCLGRTAEVDKRTVQREVLREGKIKILMSVDIGGAWLFNLRFRASAHSHTTSGTRATTSCIKA